VGHRIGNVYLVAKCKAFTSSKNVGQVTYTYMVLEFRSIRKALPAETPEHTVFEPI
jgi:hypothetical protein